MGIKKLVGKTSIRVGKKKSKMVLNMRTLRAASRLTKLALSGGSGTAVHLYHHSRIPEDLLVSCSMTSSGDQSFLAGEASGYAFFITKLLANNDERNFPFIRPLATSMKQTSEWERS